MKVSIEPIITKYAIAHHELAGISVKLTVLPVAPDTPNKAALEISICNPKLKYGLKLAACFFVYKDPIAHEMVAATEIIIPKRKSAFKKSFR